MRRPFLFFIAVLCVVVLLVVEVFIVRGGASVQPRWMLLYEKAYPRRDHNNVGHGDSSRSVEVLISNSFSYHNTSDVVGKQARTDFVSDEMILQTISASRIHTNKYSLTTRRTGFSVWNSNLTRQTGGSSRPASMSI